MVNLNALNSILSVRNGVWSIVILFVAALWRGWPAFLASWVARRKAIAEEKAADWVRLRDEVTRYLDRLTAVEKREQDCQRQLNEALGRLAQVEGFMTGQGYARQDAARIVAVERLTDSQKKDKPDA